MKNRISFSKKIIALIQLTILTGIQFLLTPIDFFHYFLLLDFLIIVGVYSFRGYEIENLKSLNNTIVSYTLGSFMAHLLMLIPIVLQPRQFPKLPFFTTGFVSITILPIVAYLFAKWYFKILKPQHYLVIGKKEEIGKIMDEIQKASMGKIQVYSYMNPSAAALSETLEKEKTFDKILIADPNLIDGIKHLLEKAREKNIEIVYLPTLVEDTLKRIPIEVIKLFDEYYEIAFSKHVESSVKRLIDIIGSIIGLVVFSPVMLIVALAILIEDGRPVVFKQKRVGLNNRPFILHKFRTMKGENKEAKFAGQEKDRIMKVGKWARPSRMDEILQFYDIFRGNMSIVGPRPEQEKFVKEYSEKIPFYSYRHKAKPGLTGWAQINYSYSETIEQTKMKLSYDLWYVKNRNILLDLSIILRTIETVLFRRGGK
ncbi:MAG TPA: sugar transferase [Thermotogaceae bacterium]|nr:sugar transferase [Thermotogaceae bacterium]